MSSGLRGKLFGLRSGLIGLISESRPGTTKTNLAVFPVEEIAHGFVARSVRASIGFQRVRGCLGVCRLFFAAVGTAVREARLAGLEFEFLAADYAGFGGIGHISMIQGGIGNAQAGEPAAGFANSFEDNLTH